MRLVIHVGRHKTGSTAVQEHFGSTEHVDLCYPSAGMRDGGGSAFVANHHGLAFSLNDPASVQGAGPVEAIVDGIVREADGAETVLLSSEVLQWTSPARTDGLRSIASRLGAEETLVVAYVREYHAYVRSGFQELIKGDRRSHDFLAYARWYADLDLAAFARRLSDIGPIRLRAYDRSRFPAGDVVRDFHDLIDVPWCEASTRSDDANPSIGGSLLLLQCLLNRIGHTGSLDRAGLRDIAVRHPRFGVPPSIDVRTRESLEQGNCYQETFATLFPDADLVPPQDGAPLHPDLLAQDLPLLREELRLSASQGERALAVLGEAAGWFRVDARWP